MGDPAAHFTLHEAPVPAGLPVTQVCGWLLCPVTGRVLIQEHDDGVFNLHGGRREPGEDQGSTTGG
jgi:8-oxo-dGTP diphosphatase